jgi:hypothetical protein
MKYVKMLGLAAVAALALMAVVGASSASASTLCSTNATPCSGTTYGSGTKISSQLKSGTDARLTSSVGTVTCTKSAVGGKVTNGEGHGTIETFSFTGCTGPFGEGCDVEAVGLPYTAQAIDTGANDDLTVSPDPTDEPGAHVDCGFVINCTFTVEEITLGVVGGNPAIISAVKEPLKREGGFCPEEAFWDAEYEVTAPKPLFIV